MNVFLTKFAVAICIAFFFIAINYADAQEGPGGLLTDLIPPVSLAGKKKAAKYPRIHSTSPFFSWTVPGTKLGAHQLSYRILVADAVGEIEKNNGNIWDSKEVHSSNSVAVPYTGPSLQPDKIYYWKVRSMTSAASQGGWSDIVAFKTSSDLKPYAAAWQELEKTTQYPVSLQNNNDHTLLADFGRDAFSQLRLKLYSAAGHDTVTVQLGEVISGKQIHANPGGTIRFQEIRLPLEQGTFDYEVKTRPDQRNTGPAAIKMPEYIGEVFPFRYVSIRGYKGHLQKEDISRQMVHYPFDDKAAYFKSSDTLLNAIWELCRYSMKATSFAGIYVDGDRERIPYEADALINQLGHYGTDREFSMARRSLEYLLQYPTWPTEWILQAPIIAWNDYLYTGDNRVLQSNYDLLKSRTLLQLRDSTGLISTAVGQDENFSKSIHFKGKIRDIVDWPVPETDGFIFCKYNAVVNAYHYQALILMEKIASALDKTPDRLLFSKLSKQLKETYNRYFLDKSRGIYKDGDTTAHASLHANMFALHFGLVPAEMRNSVADFIVSKGMACSVYGAQFLMDALYDAGRQDAALSLLTSRDERSWYNMIRVGSTITLEAWDNKFKPNQDWNHAWGAAPANIIPRRLMGVMPMKPGFQIFSVRPQTGVLKYAESLIPTIRGSIKVRVENGEAYRLILTVPANSSAMVALPVIEGKNIVRLNGKMIKARQHTSDRYAEIAVGPGNHDFTITAAL
ncbi:alpha-L-rhamnosidase C-terminal domain-containing protein [Pedobacter sp. JY14-1]|uniref:alpha-L-rhamnosidase-related protein n=1 Tax=Pedobacter sp. JY14-1 TaxID=3034151 RepID=UPI0023E14440|nr:alpha-L-rhamnosidase C-terminal domain-containing protein [Pedobacter sp. JY14-1]